jgi:hypothetical protein
MSAFAAAYPLAPGASGKFKKSPQCSQSSDFCFLCEYATTGNGDSDVVGDMKALARAMAEDGKEVPTIVAAVSEMYAEQARDFVQWKQPSGIILDKPEWSDASITRHLLFGAQSPIFDNAVDQIFTSIILNLNNSLLDKENGLVVEEHRKALMDTVRTQLLWKKRKRSGSG